MEKNVVVEEHIGGYAIERREWLCRRGNLRIKKCDIVSKKIHTK